MVDVEYNPFAPGFTDDPYPQLAQLRDEDPVHHTDFGVWLVFRYDDVNRFLRDATLSVDPRHAHPTVLDEIAAEAVGEREVLGRRNMLNVDPPDHTRLRRLVSKAFTPRTIERLRDRAVEIVDAALDRAAEQGEIELIADLAFPLPFQLITEMLGMPDTDTEQLRAWTSLLVLGLEPVVDPDTVRAMDVASQAFDAHIRETIAWKRDHPGDDLLTAMIAAEEGGDVLTEDELADQVALLYIAGHETTVNLIGNGGLALVRNPDERRRWRDDPSLDVSAIDELLRYDSPVQNSRRITLGEVEIEGRTIEPGAFVVLALASGNRDPRRWGPTADTVDLGRADASQHLSFGGGHHHCLGASLARLEGQVALGRLVRRFGSIELADEPTWNGRINLRGLDRLPLAVGP